jgi:hypothetical protein
MPFRVETGCYLTSYQSPDFFVGMGLVCVVQYTMVVTYTEVTELLEGRGLRPSEEDYPTVFNVVLERLTEERGIETYEDLYDLFTEAGYERDFALFMDACAGTMDTMNVQFVRGVTDVLKLDEEEKAAFCLAHLRGSK